ncbi:MAG: LysM peptidoglycan-binding domain-containing protein [Bacteroidetes bacterium]|nr:LysM peptidoglycan-binding domain-containing protein [Bacteroidota bacterium]
MEKGDTVFEIAKHYATTTASIKEINGLSGRIRLRPGQVICVAQ